MTNFKYPVTLAIFFATLFIFSACKKEVYFGVDPLSVAGAKPGDTLIIKGKKLSDNPAENIVKINGIDAAVVEATSTELKVVIPANASSGNVTVTVNENTVEIGSLYIMPLTLFCIKRDLSNPNKPVKQIIAIDPETGKPSVFVTLPDTYEFEQMHELIYVAATNELIGFSYWNDKLLKVNVATKQTTVLPLTTANKVHFGNLVLDKNGQLYAIKSEGDAESLVKLDPETGNHSVVTLLKDNGWGYVTYLPVTNELVAITKIGRALTTLNLTSKERTDVPINNPGGTTWQIAAVGSEIYCYKHVFISGDNQYGNLIKIDQKTGAETVIEDIDDRNLPRRLKYVPERKEIFGITVNADLWRYNVNTKTSAYFPLPVLIETDYHSLTSN